MYAKQRGVEKVVKKGSTRKRKNLSDSKKPECGNEEDDDKNKPITDASTSSRKRKDLSESKKPDCGNEKEDNKNKSVADAFKSQSVNEKQGGKKVGRKRKNDVKVSENEKKTKVSSEYFSCIKESTSESVDTTMESTKNDLPGMSLRRSRKTRQSGSSMSDRETDVIITTPVDPLKLEDGGRNGKEQKKEKEREEQVEKFPILSAKEPEIKKTKSIQNANEGKQTNLYEDIVNETQSVVENSRKMKRGKNAAIKESSSKEKSKEGDERPMTRHSTRSSQRTLSKRSESISSGSERDFKSLEIPLMDTVSQEAQQLPKTLNQKLKENTDLTENISLEQDTDIELQQNISNKGLEVTVVRKVEIQKSNPILPTTIRKRGRKKIKVDDLVPSADKKTAVKSGLDTESLNVGDEVLNKRKGKNRRNLACVPKKMENSISEGNEKTVTDFSIHAEMKNEHKKKSASNDSLSTDSRNTIAMEEESEKISSDTTNMDGISKLSHFISKDNDASNSEEKGSQGKKDKVMVVRGRRGRKKLNQSRGRKFGYKAKNSGQVHLASDSEDNGIASKDTGTLEVLNQASIAPLFKSKTSRKRMSPPHSNEELGREKLLKSSGMVQRVDSMLCAVPSSENIPLKGDEISESSDFELCLNKPDTAHQRKNQKTNLNKELRSKRTKDLEKDELGNFDYSSSNVDSNDKCDKDVRRRVFKGKKRRGGVFKQKSRKIRLSSVHLAKGKVEQTKKVSYLERMKRTFSLKDLSIVVEKLDINNPQILKSMSHIFPTNESTGNMEEKTKGIQKEIIDITAVDSMVPSTQTSKPADKSLEKEAIVHANTKNIEETTFLDTEKLDELIENQIPNLEVSVHTENALAHCDDQESKNTQTDCFEKLSDNLITSSCEKLCHTNDSEKLPVEIKNVPDFSICNREEILDMDQDKSANILESENFNPSERGILEKHKKLESISNSLYSDTTSTCDENQLDAEISMNPLEKTTDNKNDLLNQPISTNKNKTSSESLEYSCDSSRTSIGEEDKTSNSTEINLNVSETKSDSKSLIGSEDVFIVINSSECSEDSMHSKTVLLSVKQDKMKECYVNMSEAIDICNTYQCKKKASKKTNTESKICFNSTVSPAQNNPIDIKNSTKDTNANEAVHEGQENSEKELVVNTAIEEVAEVTDSGLEDEIVAALEDSIEVNDELEVREVYNAAIKDMKEITGCGLDELAAQDVDRDITEIELGSKNDDVLEVQSKAVQKEQPLIQSDMTIKDGKEIKINESKRRKEAAYDVIKDESGSAFEKEIDTLEEVSEKALEETVESSTNIDKIHELKSGKEVVYDVIESGSAFEKEIDTLEEVREKALEETVESGTNIDKINELRSGKEVGFDAIEDESGSAFEKKIDTLEEVSEKALEETVESGTNIDKINEIKSGKEVGYDVMEDESGNGFVKGIGTLEEVSEKAPEETIESDTNIDKINELKSGKEVGYDVMEDESGNGFVKRIDTVEEVSEKAPEETIESDTCLEEQTKSDAALEQVDCVKEQDKSNAVLKLCKTKCDVPLHKDEKNVDNDKNLEDLKQDVRDINLEHKRELKCGTTKKERETALQGRTEVDLDTALQNQQKNKKNETHQELQQARTHETSKAQLKPKYTAKFILQRFSGNTETKERDQDNAADESRNETCAILEHQSKVKKEAFRDKISEPVCESDNRNENALDFTESNMFNRMQKYFNMESPPSNFLSAIKSDMKLLHSEPNSQGIDFNEDDCNKYFVDAGKKDQCVESSLKLNKSKVLESPKVPIEQNSDNFESNQSKPGSSNAITDKTAKKRKIEEAEPKTYYWPKFSNQLAWEYLQPFVPVLHTALDSILENNPRDPIQYFSQWLNDHKAEAYFMMASIPLAPEFKLKKPKR